MDRKTEAWWDQGTVCTTQVWKPKHLVLVQIASANNLSRWCVLFHVFQPLGSIIWLHVIRTVIKKLQLYLSRFSISEFRLFTNLEKLSLRQPDLMLDLITVLKTVLLHFFNATTHTLKFKSFSICVYTHWLLFQVPLKL